MSAPCPQLGFVVAVSLLPNVTDRAENVGDALIDELAECLETNGLVMGGGRGRGGSGAFERVITREGTQATQADREIVLAWARLRVDRAVITVGDIRDLLDP